LTSTDFNQFLSSQVPKTFFIVVGSILGVVLIIILAIHLWYQSRLGIIQLALDEQCGKEVILVSSGSYDDDPIESWYSSEVTCFWENAREGFTCNCVDSIL
jgi:hypothetical protein